LSTFDQTITALQAIGRIQLSLSFQIRSHAGHGSKPTKFHTGATCFELFSLSAPESPYRFPVTGHLGKGAEIGFLHGAVFHRGCGLASYSTSTRRPTGCQLLRLDGCEARGMKLFQARLPLRYTNNRSALSSRAEHSPDWSNRRERETIIVSFRISPLLNICCG